MSHQCPIGIGSRSAHAAASVLLSEAITISAALAQRPAAASICDLDSMLFRLNAVQTTASPLAPLNRASHIVDRRRQARAPLHTFVRHHPRMVPASASCVSAASRTLAAFCVNVCSDAPLHVLSVPCHKPTTPKSRVRFHQGNGCPCLFSCHLHATNTLNHP